MSVSRRSLLGGLFGIPVATTLSKIAAAGPRNDYKVGPHRVTLGRPPRPESDDWMAADPVILWIAAAKFPDRLHAPIFVIMGKYGIKKFPDHRLYYMADGAQTVVLRYLGRQIVLSQEYTLREREQILDVVYNPKQPPELLKAAKDWLWVQYNRELPREDDIPVS